MNAWQLEGGQGICTPKRRQCDGTCLHGPLGRLSRRSLVSFIVAMLLLLSDSEQRGREKKRELEEHDG